MYIHWTLERGNNMSETTRKSFQSKLADFFKINEETSQKEKQAIGQRLKDFAIPVPEKLLKLQEEMRKNVADSESLNRLAGLGLKVENMEEMQANLLTVANKIAAEITVEQAEYQKLKDKAREDVFAILVSHYND